MEPDPHQALGASQTWQFSQDRDEAFCSLRSLWREEGRQGLTGGLVWWSWLLARMSPVGQLASHPLRPGSTISVLMGYVFKTLVNWAFYGKMLTEKMWDGEILRQLFDFFKVSPTLAQCSRRASLWGDPLAGLVAWSSRSQQKMRPSWSPGVRPWPVSNQNARGPTER